MLAQPLSPLLFLHVFISLVLILNNGFSGFSSGASDFHINDHKNFDQGESLLMRDVRAHKSANSKPLSQWNLFGIPGDGYYITALIGTPPQKVNLLVDTGSSNLAVAGTSSGELDSFFNASQSSSFKYLNNSHLKVSYSQGWWQGSLGTDIVVVPSVSRSLQTRSFVALITKSHGFYVNGSHWQGILGLAFPELAQPNRTIQPWFDSVISSKKSTNFQREKSSMSSLKLNVESDFVNDPKDDSKVSFLDDGLDLDEFLRRTGKLPEQEQKELQFSQVNNGRQALDISNAHDSAGAVKMIDILNGPALKGTSAKEVNSSAIVLSNLPQVTDSFINKSSELMADGDVSGAVIQTLRLGLAHTLNDIPANQNKAKNFTNDYLNSTSQDDDVLSVIRVLGASTGNDSDLNGFPTLNFTEMSLLYEKNESKILQEVTVKAVTEFDFISAIPLTEFFSDEENFDHQQESSSDGQRKFRVLKAQKMKVKLNALFNNESSGTEVGNRNTGTTERESVTAIPDSIVHTSNPSSAVRNSAPRVSHKEGESRRKNPFHIEAGPKDGNRQSRKSSINSSESSESFTLELCGPWSSAPLFNTHEGRLSLGGVSGCGHPAYETPIVAPWFYEVAVTGVTVGSTRLPLPCSVYNHHASIVDSGTTKLKLPQAALDAVVHALEEAAAELLEEPLPPRFWRGTGHVCWSPAHEAWSQLPHLRIDIALSNSSSFSIELGPRSYLRPVLNTPTEDTDASVLDNVISASDGISDASVPVSVEDLGSLLETEDHKFFAAARDTGASVFRFSNADERSNVSASEAPEISSTGSKISFSAEERHHSSVTGDEFLPLLSSGKDNHANNLQTEEDANAFNSIVEENSPVSLSIDLHVTLNQPSDRVPDTQTKETDTPYKTRPIATKKRSSLVQSHAQENVSSFSGSQPIIPCWSSGIELSDMGTVLGAVVLEGLCVHFDRGRGVVGFSESSCGPKVKLSGPHTRRETEICAAPHRDVMESEAGEAGTVVLAAILVLLCCPFALFVVRALWRLARHRFLSLQQAETTFLSLDESTSVT